MDWISVKDQLPEYYTVVQVWRNGWTTAKLVMVGETNLWHFEGDRLYTYEEPSHWMPLPTKP